MEREKQQDQSFILLSPAGDIETDAHEKTQDFMSDLEINPKKKKQKNSERAGMNDI